MTLIANGRIWIETEEGPFLGYGRMELLQKISELGSLRKAATAMKISYRQAWDFVDQMNKRTSQPLVIFERGGKNGGGALLTPEGIHAMQLFEELNSAFQDFLAVRASKLNKRK
ncbi:winged helix-turn-helix domain-containing protein [Chitinophaga arvensicola]|uniref:Molybdate transport system regulatory protein n=1 Tax=Chitinophaga arvensicola TaxID=29529 RepID=A0A1I0R4P1_9BACT|nr:LysR family transcriptional regulator [Chitinophaga arvensicola]SEW35423.1 molybdate transport system regulatory protein [Chitinophaga arvensicola]